MLIVSAALRAFRVEDTSHPARVRSEQEDGDRYNDDSGRAKAVAKTLHEDAAEDRADCGPDHRRRRRAGERARRRIEPGQKPESEGVGKDRRRRQGPAGAATRRTSRRWKKEIASAIRAWQIGPTKSTARGETRFWRMRQAARGRG